MHRSFPAIVFAVLLIGCAEGPSETLNPGTPTLAIVIEEPTVCDTLTVDCTATDIGSAGGLALTDSGFAGALIPAGALDQTVQVIIRRVPEHPCLPTDLLQFDGCYVFETVPHVENFLVPVTIGVCLDPDVALSEEQQDQLLVHKFEQDDPDSVVTATDNVFVGFLTCAPFQSASRVETSPLIRLARRTYDGLLRLVLLRPEPAWAVHKGLGSTVGSFSQAAWALPAILTIEAGDGQSAPAGATVPVSPAVRLRDSAGAPIEGMVVRFRIGQGGGSLAQTMDVTDANGVATAGTWTLGEPGPNTVIVESRGAVGSPTVLTATASAAPVIDGILAPGEWDAATAFTFTARVSGGPTPATLYVLPHGENLYLALELATDRGRMANLRLDFDNDGDGAPGLSDDALTVSATGMLEDLHLTAACLRPRQSACGLQDVRAGGTRDGLAATGQGNGQRVYELAHPLNSGDSHDIAVHSGDAFGLFLSLGMGNGAQGNTQWPGFRVYLPFLVP